MTNKSDKETHGIILGASKWPRSVRQKAPTTAATRSRAQPTHCLRRAGGGRTEYVHFALCIVHCAIKHGV